MTADRVILGFDTATAETAVATWRAGEATARSAAPADSGRPLHAARLLPIVEELVADAGGWDEIGLIAVGIGPGSFTGLRIGVATARGLAQSLRLPLAGVGSTSALLAGIASSPAAAGRTPLAMIDARRGEVFAAFGAATGAEPIVCAPTELAARFGPEAVASAAAAGDGAVRFRAEIEAAGALVLPDGDDAQRLSASWICELAATLEPVGPERIRPMYLRRPDAERWRERNGN